MKKTTIFIFACILANVAFGQIPQSYSRTLTNGTFGQQTPQFSEQARTLANGAFSEQGTTQEEYNYITKGYKIQIESGLDMKQGYVLVDVPMFYNGSISNTATKTDKNITRTFEFKKLIRTKNNQVCALMIIYSRSGQANNYICIPMKNSSQDVWDVAVKDLDKYSDEVYRAITWALVKFISNESF